MIVQAFLRWSEKAGSTERAKAANALGRAYLQSDMARENRDAAYMAMTYLLDDPSPRVRLVFGKRNENGARCVMGIRQRLGKRQPHTR